MDQLRTDQLRMDQRAQPALISPCILRFEHCSPSLRSGGAHPYYTLQYVDSLLYIVNTQEMNSSVPALHLGSCCIIIKSSIGPYVNCESQCHLGRRLVHAFDSKDLIDVYLTDGQTGGDHDLPTDPAAEPESEESASEEGVSEPEPTLHGRTASPDALPSASPVTVLRDTTSGLPPSPSPPSPPRGCSRTRSPQSPPSGDRRQAPLGPDTPLFDSRIPPGTSTQSPNTSISPSTLFDTFDSARRLLEARHGRPDASRVDPGTSSAFSEQ
ncbi:hypothetical protein IEO21_10442 [Rhodonia placenta]|uniref:Uncharacterized protein n=1 Tax=Rhodonia placenta TaxID=104341 RepID=A0A8H7NSK0_9APHY|nr:hypothetical protein IEO21_10442 [Postia placenta]